MTSNSSVFVSMLCPSHSGSFSSGYSSWICSSDIAANRHLPEAEVWRGIRVPTRISARRTWLLSKRLTIRASRLERIANETASLLAEARSEEHTSELQSRENLVCRLLLEKKKDM